MIDEPEDQVNVVRYPLAKQGRDDILDSLVKPPSLSLSPEQVARAVTFSRKHYERVGSPVVHKLTEKDFGRNTLKIRRGFHQDINIPSSGSLYMWSEPVNFCFGEWFEDQRGRFSLEKESWNEFACKAGFRIGSIIILCTVSTNGQLLCFLNGYENLQLVPSGSIRVSLFGINRKVME